MSDDFMSTEELLRILQGDDVSNFVPCHVEEEDFETAFGMGEGPFGAAWWGLEPRVRRELAMLGASMMTAGRLRAGPFNTLDLPSFVQIVRTAYSYYAVLGQTSK